MKTLLPILLLCISLSSYSQKTSLYDNIPLAKASDYRKAEPEVMLACDYVYTTPVDKENMNRNNAVTFIVKWMQGTSDYPFVMDKTVYTVTNNDNMVLSVYFACLSKYALEKGKGVDREDLKYNSFLLLANYFENPANNYKPRGEMKKLVDAKNQNKLKEFLDSKK
jgi:hypothetical protein